MKWHYDSVINSLTVYQPASKLEAKMVVRFDDGTFEVFDVAVMGVQAKIKTDYTRFCDDAGAYDGVSSERDARDKGWTPNGRSSGHDVLVWVEGMVQTAGDANDSNSTVVVFPEMETSEIKDAIIEQAQKNLKYHAEQKAAKAVESPAPPPST